MVGTDSIGSAAGSDFVMHMIALAHIEANTGCDIDWVRTMQDDMTVAPVHPEPTPHSSSSRYQRFSPSGAGMLWNVSFHALPTYIIYKRGFSRYLKPFVSIKTLRQDAL